VEIEDLPVSSHMNYKKKKPVGATFTNTEKRTKEMGYPSTSFPPKTAPPQHAQQKTAINMIISFFLSPICKVHQLPRFYSTIKAFIAMRTGSRAI
jgi:hypothetical protein